MKTALVRIGKSRGVRIPKEMIKKCGLGETLNLRVENDFCHYLAGAAAA